MSISRYPDIPNIPISWKIGILERGKERRIAKKRRY